MQRASGESYYNGEAAVSLTCNRWQGSEVRIRVKIAAGHESKHKAATSKAGDVVVVIPISTV